MGGTVRCRCGAKVHVPEAGQFVPCPKCRMMVTLPAQPPSAAASGRTAAPQPSMPHPDIPMAGAPAPAAPTQAGPPDETPCPGCGAPMGPGMTQCLACGYQVRGPAVQRVEAGGGSALGKFVLLGVAALIIGGAVYGIIVATSKPAEPIKPDESGYSGVMVQSMRRAKELKGSVELQHTIQAFHALEGRYPKDLDEPAQKGMPIPPPPRGYRYEYNPQTGEAKVVRIEPSEEAPSQ